MKRFIAALLVSSMLMMTACSASEKNVESSGPETGLSFGLRSLICFRL